MPGLQELTALSQSYGLAMAVLILAVTFLAYAVKVLYQENRAVEARLEAVLEERVKVLEALITESINGGNKNARS